MNERIYKFSIPRQIPQSDDFRKAIKTIQLMKLANGRLVLEIEFSDHSISKKFSKSIEKTYGFFDGRYYLGFELEGVRKFHIMGDIKKGLDFLCNEAMQASLIQKGLSLNIFPQIRVIVMSDQIGVRYVTMLSNFNKSVQDFIFSKLSVVKDGEPTLYTGLNVTFSNGVTKLIRASQFLQIVQEALGFLSDQIKEDHKLNGSGTKEDPYQLNQLIDWFYVASKINSREKHEKDTYVKLGNQIIVIDGTVYARFVDQEEKDNAHERQFIAIFESIGVLFPESPAQTMPKNLRSMQALAALTDAKTKIPTESKKGRNYEDMSQDTRQLVSRATPLTSAQIGELNLIEKLEDLTVERVLQRVDSAEMRFLENPRAIATQYLPSLLKNNIGVLSTIFRIDREQMYLFVPKLTYFLKFFLLSLPNESLLRTKNGVRSINFEPLCNSMELFSRFTKIEISPSLKNRLTNLDERWLQSFLNLIGQIIVHGAEEFRDDEDQNILQSTSVFEAWKILNNETSNPVNYLPESLVALLISETSRRKCLDTFTATLASFDLIEGGALLPWSDEHRYTLANTFYPDSLSGFFDYYQNDYFPKRIWEEIGAEGLFREFLRFSQLSQFNTRDGRTYVSFELVKDRKGKTTDELLQEYLFEFVKGYSTDTIGVNPMAHNRSYYHAQSNDNKLSLVDQKVVSILIQWLSQQGQNTGSMKNRVGNAVESDYTAGLKERLREIGLNYQPVPGDGHCLFHAVSVYVNQEQSFLRQIVAAHLEHNIQEFEGFLETSGRSINEYIQDVREGREWASHVEIEVLMRVLNRPIIIVGSDGEIRNVADKDRFTGELIFTYYNDKNHYDALVLANLQRNGREVSEKLEQFGKHSRESYPHDSSWSQNTSWALEPVKRFASDDELVNQADDSPEWKEFLSWVSSILKSRMMCFHSMCPTTKKLPQFDPTELDKAVEGPSVISGWLLQDSQESDSFCHAVSSQLKLIYHHFEFPFSKDYWNLATLHSMFSMNNDDAFMLNVDPNIDKLVRLFKVNLAVIHSFSSETMYRYTYYDSNRSIVIETLDPEDLPRRPTMRLIFTGKHYLSIIKDPSDYFESAIVNSRFSFFATRRSLSDLKDQKSEKLSDLQASIKDKLFS